MTTPRVCLPLVCTLTLAALLGSSPAAVALTEKDVLTSATALDSGSSYNGGALPGTSSDLTFTASSYANTALTINNTSLSIGTLDDLDATQALTISASKSLTLDGGGDAVAGSASGDLLYLASGANLTYGGTGGIALGSFGFFDTAGTAQLTINAPISGSYALSKTGAGTLTLTGNNSYTNGTTFAAGTLNVGSAGAVGSSGTLSFTGGTLQYSAASSGVDFSSRFSSAANQAINLDTNGQNVTIGHGFGGSGTSLTVLGSGTLTINGANTYTGATNLNAGVVTVNNPSALGQGGTISFGGGTLQYGNTSYSDAQYNAADYSARFSTADSQAFNIDTNGHNITYGTGLVSGGGSLTKLGSGTLTLAGANSYGGNTTVSAGTLALTGSFVGSQTAYRMVIVTGTSTAGATLSVSGTASLNAGASDIDVGMRGSGTINQPGGIVTTTEGLNVGNFPGALGTYNLSGTAILNADAIGVGVNGGIGTFNQTGGTVSSPGNAIIVGYNGLGGNASPFGTYNLSGGTVTCQGIIGSADFPAGNLRGTSIFNFNGGTLQSSGSVYSGSFVGAVTTANVQAGGAIIDTQANDIYIPQNLVHDTTSGAPALDGGLTKLGTGSLTLSGANTYTGNTTVSNGILAVTGSVASGSGSLLTLDGATASSTLALSGSGSFSVGSAVVGDTAYGTIAETGGLFTTNGGSVVVGNSAHGNGTVNLSGGSFSLGGGTLTLGNVATSQGQCNLSGGTLIAGSVLGGSGTSIFDFAGGTLQPAASSTTFLQGLTTANVQAGGAVFNTAGFDDTVAQNLQHDTTSGAPALDGGLTKLGSGTLTLTGTNTFTGPVDVLAGTLGAASEASLGTNPTVTLSNTSTLNFTGTSTLTHTYNLNTGKLGAAAGSTVTFGSGATVNGGSLASGGTYAFSDGSALNSTTALIGSTLTQAGGTTAWDNVTLRGSFAQSGGTLNATDGLTVTTSGTLAVGGTTNLGNGGEVDGVATVNSGGTLATGTGSLYLGGGSRTTVNAGGMLAAASGTTVELNGGLLVNNGTQTGVLDVNYGSTAKGTGTFGTVNVSDGGQFGVNASSSSAVTNSPVAFHLTGTSGPAGTAFVGPQLSATPGTANVVSLALGSGSVFTFNVQNAQGVAGTSYDTAHASSTLSLTAGTTAGNQITISIASLAADGTAGLASNFDPTKSYSFVLVTADGGITGFDPAEFTVNTTGFQNATNGGVFSIAEQGDNLNLMFNAVPEPSAWALLVLGAGGLLFVVRRRERWMAA